MAHSHALAGHSHGAHAGALDARRARNRRRMKGAISLNGLMLAAGVAGGILFRSLALLADAGHVLSDIGALALGLLAARLAARPATGRRTFGSRRTEVMAALVNGLALAVVAVLVFVGAATRLSDPPDVRATGVLLVGVLGLVGNALAGLVLIGGDREDLNLEAVLRHSVADALGSLGVIVSAAVVLSTGWRYADPLVGLLIGLLILAGSWRLVRVPLDVLMEAAPEGVDVGEVGRAMAAVPGVREVHDLHVWTVTSGFPALAAHVRVDPSRGVDGVRRAIEAVLVERFAIEHTTLQAVAEPLLELEDRRGS
jgi:cobalt-zinc-cadmium efflux system protein